MKSFRGRKWLAINPNKQINLSLNDVDRIGLVNTKKLQLLSQKVGKKVLIHTQYSNYKK